MNLKDISTEALTKELLSRFHPRNKLNIRSFMEGYFTVTEVFEAEDLVNLAKMTDPRVNEDSVRAELSVFKRNGKVECLKRGTYRSLIFQKEANNGTI